MVLSAEYEKGARARSAEAGISLVEVLIATLLLFLIVMGLIPLFARSAVNNAMGADATQISNQAKSQLDRVLNSGFNGNALTVPAGATEGVTVEYWDPDREAFTTTVPTNLSTVRWRRTTRVRQYSMSALDDGVITPSGLDSDALAGDIDASFVSLKEVEVVVESFPGRTGSAGIPARRIVTKTLVAD